MSGRVGWDKQRSIAAAQVLASAELHGPQEVIFHFARTTQLPPV